MSEYVPTFDVDGFEPKEDLSHLTEHELSHRILNSVIWLAHERGISIEELLTSLLRSHVIVKEAGRVMAELADRMEEGETPLND